ncbi:helix-turn-helix domain-containing protein [Rhodopseudomonas sp. NSM]|uniref:helix-turn-helix domain-containing protein n=1 Tax=Rhodopseudomonas sp. NSM TaxID=3457630 RepID=UPI0040351513
MVGRRHASEEIASKLAQADELAAKGKTQREISKALGVSVMTYHRWKKMPVSTTSGSANAGSGSMTSGQMSSGQMTSGQMTSGSMTSGSAHSGANSGSRTSGPIAYNDAAHDDGRHYGALHPADLVAHLELENSRLRKLVTDLLLEKIGLEEDLRDRYQARLRRPEKTK